MAGFTDEGKIGKGVTGGSAGAILTTEVTVRLKQLGLPLPAALGIFSGLAASAAPATRGNGLPLTGCPASCSRPMRIIRTIINTSAKQIGESRCCLLCSPICAGCRRACW